MSFASRHNKQSQFTNIPNYGEKPRFASLKELYNENGADCKYFFHGFYVNKKGNFGNSPAAYLDTCICNLPQHLLDEMIEFSDEDIRDINDNKVGFIIETYEKNNKTCYGIQWIDM